MGLDAAHLENLSRALQSQIENSGRTIEDAVQQMERASETIDRARPTQTDLRRAFHVAAEMLGNDDAPAAAAGDQTATDGERSPRSIRAW